MITLHTDISVQPDKLNLPHHSPFEKQKANKQTKKTPQNPTRSKQTTTKTTHTNPTAKVGCRIKELKL